MHKRSAHRNVKRKLPNMFDEENTREILVHTGAHRCDARRRHLPNQKLKKKKRKKTHRRNKQFFECDTNFANYNAI